MQVSPAKRQFSRIMAFQAPWLNIPKILKSSAISSGYIGATQALGPVLPVNGEEKPSPATIERAMLPDSNPKKYGLLSTLGYPDAHSPTAARSRNPSNANQRYG